MKSTILNTAFWGLFFVTLVSCEKVVETDEHVLLGDMVVFQDEEIEKTLDITVNGDIALCTYLDVLQGYRLKLIDSSGNELWTKPLPPSLQPSINGVLSQRLDKVLVDKSDNTFVLIYGQQLAKINKDGEEVLYIQDFLPISFFNKFDAEVDSEGNYMFVGKRNSRAFVIKVTPEGEEIFRNIFFISIPGDNSFTAIHSLNNGNYLLAGTHESLNIEIPNSIFLAEIDGEGDFVRIETDSISPSLTPIDANAGNNTIGREFYQLSDGSFIYPIADSHYAIPNPVSSILNVTDSGKIVRRQLLDLSPSNYAVGATSFGFASNKLTDMGTGLLLNQDGTFTGLVNTENPVFLGSSVSPFGITPSYIYELSAEGNLVSMTYINRNQSTYFTSIGQFTNGRKLAQGSFKSLDGKSKMVLLFF